MTDTTVRLGDLVDAEVIGAWVLCLILSVNKEYDEVQLLTPYGTWRVWSTQCDLVASGPPLDVALRSQ